MPTILMNRAAVERAIANASGPMTEQQRRAMFARRREQGASRGSTTALTEEKYRERFGSFPRLVYPAPASPGEISVPPMPRAAPGRVSIAMKYGGGTTTVSGGTTRTTRPPAAMPVPGSRANMPPVRITPDGRIIPLPDRGVGLPGWYVPGGGGGPGLSGSLKPRKSARK